MSDQESIRRTRARPSDQLLLNEMKSRFDYDAILGCLRWKNPPRNVTRFKSGDIVGGQGSQRYSAVYLLGHRFKVHRLIWLWHHECYPTGDIDHINGNTNDNRIDNLRIATRAQNAANRMRKSKYGTGVDATADGKFVARITVPGTRNRIYLGRFDTKNEAAAAYIGASVVMHGEFSLAMSRPLDRITI